MMVKRDVLSCYKENRLESKKFELNLRIFNKLLFILIIVLLIYYVAGANGLTVKGFELEELKRATKELEAQNSSLEIEAMALGSYNNLNEKVKKLNMVAVSKVEYISSAEALVAKK